MYQRICIHIEVVERKTNSRCKYCRYRFGLIASFDSDHAFASKDLLHSIVDPQFILEGKCPGEGRKAIESFSG